MNDMLAFLLDFDFYSSKLCIPFVGKDKSDVQGWAGGRAPRFG